MKDGVSCSHVVVWLVFVLAVTAQQGVTILFGFILFKLIENVCANVIF